MVLVGISSSFHSLSPSLLLSSSPCSLSLLSQLWVAIVTLGQYTFPVPIQRLLDVSLTLPDV